MVDFSLLQVDPNLLQSRSIARVPESNILGELGQGLAGIAKARQDYVQQKSEREAQEQQKAFQQHIQQNMDKVQGPDGEQFFEDSLLQFGYVEQAMKFKQTRLENRLKNLSAEETGLDIAKKKAELPSAGKSEIEFLTTQKRNALDRGDVELASSLQGKIDALGGNTQALPKSEQLIQRMRAAESRGDTITAKALESELKKTVGLTGDAAKLSGIAESASVELKDLRNFVENIENPNKALVLESVKIPFTNIRPGRALSGDTQVQILGALKDNLSDKLGRLRSGGAINEAEEARFSRLLPTVGDTKQTMEFKLKQLDREFSLINAKLRGEELSPSLLGESEVFGPKAERKEKMEDDFKAQSEPLIKDFEEALKLRPEKAEQIKRMHEKDLKDLEDELKKKSEKPMKSSQLEYLEENRDLTKPKSPFELASSFKGANEKGHKVILSSFFQKSLGQTIDPAKTPWCAAFVNAALKATGQPGTDSLMARSFLGYGQAVKYPKKGDIIVFSRDGSAVKGHVGFFSKIVKKGDASFVEVLGGNQDNQVSLKLYPLTKVLGIRRPPSAIEIAEKGIP